MTSEIPRLFRPNAARFRRDFVLPQRPAIITGVASLWPAMRWTPKSLKDRFGELSVPIETWEGGDESVNDPLDWAKKQNYQATERSQMNFGRFVDAIGEIEGRRLYSTGFKMTDGFEALRNDIGSLESYTDIPEFLPYLPYPLRQRLLEDPRIWMGPAGTVTNLHFDRSPNFFVLLSGRKKCVLISPESSADLYWPSPQLPKGVLMFSPIDIENLDLARFPRAASTTRLEVVVEPGEILYIPSGWWHHVRSLAPTISINFFWLSTLMAKVTHVRNYPYHYARSSAREAVGRFGARLKSMVRGVSRNMVR